MNLEKQLVDRSRFNEDLSLPYELRWDAFASAMQDVYDFFYDVNGLFLSRGLQRMEDMLRPAAMSGMISDMLTSSLARHGWRGLVENKAFNGHPDLIKRNEYPNDTVVSGKEGIEVKSTRRSTAAVDTHGAREQFFCVFVYQTDEVTEPANKRAPTRFTKVYIAHVLPSDFRLNGRGPLGTRTATLHKAGLKKLREGWLYLSN